MLLAKRWVCLWLLLLGCSSLQAGKAMDYQYLIQQEALNSGVPETLITAVIKVESAFREKVVSPKGAQGLMQLMPATAQRFEVKNAFDPKQNIRGGTQYLRWLYQRYRDWPLVLAAYNAGEGAVDKYSGIPPYRETRDYVRKVLVQYGKLSGQALPKPNVQPAVKKGGVANAIVHYGQPVSQNTDAQARASSVFFAE